MSWYEDWFDSPLYEKLYSNRNKEEAHLLADLIEDEIPKQSYPEILDLGCGRGRHSIALARRGYQVTGIDLSKEVVGKAEEIAEEAGLRNVTFLTGDMREPLDQRFDAVLNLLDRKSTRLNSSHVANSYAVFCLKKKYFNHQSFNFITYVRIEVYIKYYVYWRVDVLIKLHDFLLTKKIWIVHMKLILEHETDHVG